MPSSDEPRGSVIFIDVDLGDPPIVTVTVIDPKGKRTHATWKWSDPRDS